MKTFFLGRESLPHVQRGQQTTIVHCLQPVGVKKTLNQLVNDCLKEKYERTFKKAHVGQDLKEFTKRSILYHFHPTRLGSIVGTHETTD